MNFKYKSKSDLDELFKDKKALKSPLSPSKYEKFFYSLKKYNLKLNPSYLPFPKNIINRITRKNKKNTLSKIYFPSESSKAETYLEIIHFLFQKDFYFDPSSLSLSSLHFRIVRDNLESIHSAVETYRKRCEFTQFTPEEKINESYFIKAMGEIENDIYRTFSSEFYHSEPTSSRSEHGIDQKRMSNQSNVPDFVVFRSILVTFLLENPEVGYFQGLNFIVAFLMTFCSPQETLAIVLNLFRFDKRKKKNHYALGELFTNHFHLFKLLCHAVMRLF